MERTLTVPELTGLLRVLLDEAFPSGVWVEGEIANYSEGRTGIRWFDLVEPADEVGRPPVARVSVVLFDDARRRVNELLLRHGGAVKMGDGVRIRIQAMVDFYAPQGRLQLRMTTIDPSYTIGRLAAEREAVLRALRTEGLIDRNGALPIPVPPRRIGLVTASGSAARADVRKVFDRAGHGVTLVECDALVQGADAPRSLADAIDAVARAGVDLLLLVRGGGARTDLAAFDHELVARAVATCPVPVVTGIGHDVDEAVADLVAHTARATPTAAAEFVVGVIDDARRRLHDLVARFGPTAHRALASAAARVDGIHREAGHRARLVVSHARHGIDTRARHLVRVATTADVRAASHLDHQCSRLGRRARTVVRLASGGLEAGAASVGPRARRHLAAADRHLDAVESRRRALDPRRLLDRGWSMTRLADGTVVRSTAQVVPGSRVTTTLADGTFTGTIEAVQPRRDPPAGPAERQEDAT